MLYFIIKFNSLVPIKFVRKIAKLYNIKIDSFRFFNGDLICYCMSSTKDVIDAFISKINSSFNFLEGSNNG